MACYVGIDIGAVSATAAIIAQDPKLRLDGENFTRLGLAADGTSQIFLASYRRTRGKPLASASELLERIVTAVGADRLKGLCLTGSASEMVARKLDARRVNEFKAIASGVEATGLDVHTVFEMGGEASKYLRIDRNGDGTVSILDYSTNGDCAAGTGSFIDQQAGRLKYRVEDVGDICLNADRAAQVAGRCSVFAKSDMIHAQQKGYGPGEVLRGLCDAVARNFKTAVVRSHEVVPPVAFVGGVTANRAVVQAMKEAFDLDGELVIPESASHTGAIGAAWVALKTGQSGALDHLADLQASSDESGDTFPTADPLRMNDVTLLRDRVQTHAPTADDPADAYLGIDIGSVSTNVVLVDDQARMIAEIYTRTQGRPIEVVTEALKQLEADWADKVTIRGVGTTGSGRELIGALVGADTVNDEITCHKTGATYLGRKYLAGRTPDTIFEIGGQDSKYISLQDGVVVDFTMNEACAAGTGSFLEERAEELDIAIKGEFAELALSSQAPIRLGERCTVFMERDVNSYMQRGADKADLVAGLAYSVVYNYINRVVRGRAIGETIFFQGGTAYNDAVAAAFSQVTGKEIIVPPHNGVVGAIGAALLARDKMTALASGAIPPVEGSYVSEAEGRSLSEVTSSFRGYDMSQVNYTLREFTCKSCSNHCAIQEFTVEGDKTYWGDKCSEKFRKQVTSAAKPVIPDLMKTRMDLLLDESHLPAVPDGAETVGIPMTMFAWEQLPFWRTLLAHLGYRAVLSTLTNKQTINAGLQSVVAEPCFPIIVAHGHVADLADKGVDHILLPNVVSLESRWMHTESHLCPWHQTLPFMARRAPALAVAAQRFLTPTVHFRQGRSFAAKQLREFFKPLGKSTRAVNAACQHAFAAQDAFGQKFRAAGRDAMATLTTTGATGILLVGRPYNTFDAGMNLSVGKKLRETYGVNVIPMDALDLTDVDTRQINDNMFWELGRRILAAAKVVREHENLHIIYITNFKCGPDSFIKHFVGQASGKPFLTLQFDGHSNDAGMMTRCEAYLDSKGILRPWRTDRQPVAATAD